MLKAFKYRIYPNEDQKVFLSKSFGCTRYIYNWALSIRKEEWEKNKDLPKEERSKIVSVFDIDKKMTLLKQEEDTKWLSEVGSQSLQCATHNLDLAFKHFFRRVKEGKNPGYPRYKSKYNGVQSVQFPQRVVVSFDKFEVYIPKCKWVSAILHRPFEGTIKTCTVSMTPTKKYFISILVDDGVEELPVKKKVKNGSKTVGVDWGVKTFATLSNGEEVENPRLLDKWKRILGKEQRTLASRKPTSKNYLKQKIHVAKIHEKIRNIRKDFLHNASHDLIERFDTICIEDLNVAGMTRSAKGTIENPGTNVKQKSGLNKAILDVAPGEFFRQLKYKADWNGKNLLIADRFFASSKTCECGKKNEDLKLKDRTWTCECGKTVERDLNAASNIRKHCLDKVL